LARRFFFEAIRDKGDYRDAWLYLGYSYLLSDNLVEAEKTLLKAKELDPYNDVTYFYLGLTELGLEKYQLSIRSFEKASGFGYEPAYQVQEYLGHNYYKLAKFDQAINAYRQVVASNFVGMDTLLRYSWLMIEYKKDYEAAIQNGIRAVELYPNKGMSYNLLGWGYLADDDLDLAIVEFEKALEIGEEIPAVYLNLGVVYMKQERYDLADENFAQAQRMAKLTSNESIYERASYERDRLSELTLEE
jgi:tetratricopeptide (TPR) repeat protein